MPGNYEPSDDAEPAVSLDRFEPDVPDEAADPARDVRDDEPDDDADDREHRVAHRPNPLPSREEDEEELAEADILEELDLDDHDRRSGLGE